MDKHYLTIGEGRTKVCLLTYHMGNDLVVCLYNEYSHIGAVAVGEYDPGEGRASCSVITRLGHKDDAVAYKAAHSISKHTQNSVCVIAGIHIDKITKREIEQVLENTDRLMDKFLYEID